MENRDELELNIDQETSEEELEEDNKDNDKDYEDICYICRRPEHIAGKMIRMQGGICICSDCMQRTFDSMPYLG